MRVVSWLVLILVPCWVVASLAWGEPDTGTAQKPKTSTEGGEGGKFKFPEPQGDRIEAEAAAQRAAAKREEARRLGAPLVDTPDDLKRLHPEDLVWVDPKHKWVVFLGAVCKADYPLEFFVTYPDRAYESLVMADVKPSVVHTGLLAIGATPGHPARFQPEFSPPTGTEIVIEVRWKDKAGKVQTARAQDWIRNIKTKKPLDLNWVFAGSAIWNDEKFGRHYQGDSGDFICVLNLPGATLDLPLRSASDLESRLFEANAQQLPPTGTPVTVLLKPILPAKEKK